MQLIWTKLYSYFNRVNNFLTRRQSCALDFLFRSSLSAWVAVTRRVIYENIYYYHVSLLIECKMMRIIWYDWHLISLICFPPGIWFLFQVRENTAGDFSLCQPLICCIALNNTLTECKRDLSLHDQKLFLRLFCNRMFYSGEKWKSSVSCGDVFFCSKCKDLLDFLNQVVNQVVYCHLFKNVIHIIIILRIL